MDYRFLISGALLAISGVAHSGYANLAPPERFSGGSGNFTFAPSANDARYGKVAFQPGALRVPVPGVATTMPVAYRFAANAPRIAAAAIYLHPGVRTALGIAAWIGVAKIVWDQASQSWREETQPSSKLRWPSAVWGIYLGSAQESCTEFHGQSTAVLINPTTANCMHADGRKLSTQYATEQGPKTCPSGWTTSPSGWLSGDGDASGL